MKIEITPTGTMIKLGGVEVRVWDGVTEHGIACKVFVHRVAVDERADTQQFDAALKEQDAPVEARGIPLRQII